MCSMVASKIIHNQLTLCHKKSREAFYNTQRIGKSTSGGKRLIHGSVKRNREICNDYTIISTESLMREQMLTSRDRGFSAEYIRRLRSDRDKPRGES